MPCYHKSECSLRELITTSVATIMRPDFSERTLSCAKQSPVVGDGSTPSPAQDGRSDPGIQPFLAPPGEYWCIVLADGASNAPPGPRTPQDLLPCLWRPRLDPGQRRRPRHSVPPLPEPRHPRRSHMKPLPPFAHRTGEPVCNQCWTESRLLSRPLLGLSLLHLMECQSAVSRLNPLSLRTLEGWKETR